MQTDKPLSTEIDASIPTAARMYDHYLGGKDNYAADRAACEELDKVVPSTRRLALNNRRFLQRVVRTLAEEHGIRQFLDHGSGLPTQDNVHQVAQRIDPDSRVVYVDNDPMVLVHGRALLEQDERTAVIHADMRETEGILAHPDTQRLIDFSQPVAVLFNSVFHCIPDSDTDGPLAVATRVRERLVPGSAMVMCQLVSEDPEVRDFVTDFMDKATQGHWGRVRQEKDVATLFEGLEILEPGLVEVSTWRPDTEVAPRQLTHEWIEFGGVGIVR
ncbi:MAG: SAM-dependent methyltransferase [Streptomyces sp.]|uniref:SAM-dependent methyltransferase n=1 Tax=Streptomyces sp. B93 TaxID=2824875 RepID=UPI00199E951E|nr:SAM-dependent methyltransferase [Streptomyces sp. B93]MBC7272385.1 SAM-dependent methyltransferase [Streptomyces sp.]MBQ1088300.1 SAM-dependent methyltransferase [Streptomyces sp. B93]